MVYYSLARLAGRSFVSGLAGSLGRRAGSYRRRRRVAWPKSARAGNVKRTRVYRKRVRVTRSTRSVRRLWRAVRALQRTSDPDVTIRDIVSSESTVPNNTDGFTVAQSV